METEQLDVVINWINSNSRNIAINEIGRIGFYIAMNEADAFGKKKEEISRFVIDKFESTLDNLEVVAEVREYIIR